GRVRGHEPGLRPSPGATGGGPRVPFRRGPGRVRAHGGPAALRKDRDPDGIGAPAGRLDLRPPMENHWAKKKRSTPMSTASPATRPAAGDRHTPRRVRADAPPLRGEDLRRAPIVSGDPALDSALLGGLPRGAVSEIHGPASAGRTGLCLALVSGVTRRGAL